MTNRSSGPLEESHRGSESYRRIVAFVVLNSSSDGRNLWTTHRSLTILQPTNEQLDFQTKTRHESRGQTRRYQVQSSIVCRNFLRRVFLQPSQRLSVFTVVHREARPPPEGLVMVCTSHRALESESCCKEVRGWQSGIVRKETLIESHLLIDLVHGLWWVLALISQARLGLLAALLVGLRVKALSRAAATSAGED
ncbi:hypothetical protein KCU81_g7204, partial [Aureobasidium melanogenum]